MRGRRGKPSSDEINRNDDVEPERILDELVEKYLPEMLSGRMSQLLARPDEIKPGWVEYLDPDFKLQGFVTAHYERPFEPNELEELIKGYPPEEAVLMVYALAAYLHFNRLKVKLPGVKGPGKFRRKKTKRTVKHHPGKGTIPRRLIKKAIKEAIGKKGEGTEAVSSEPRTTKAAPKKRITVPGMLREMLGQEPTVAAVEEMRYQAGSLRLLAKRLNEKFVGGKATAGSISVYLAFLRKKAGGSGKKKGERDAM